MRKCRACVGGAEGRAGVGEAGCAASAQRTQTTGDADLTACARTSRLPARTSRLLARTSRLRARADCVGVRAAARSRPRGPRRRPRAPRRHLRTRDTYARSLPSGFSDVVALHALLYECGRAACTRRVSLPEDGLFLVYSMGKRAPLGAHSYGVPIAH